jgi:hypothetical protein
MHLIPNMAAFAQQIVKGAYRPVSAILEQGFLNLIEGGSTHKLPHRRGPWR